MTKRLITGILALLVIAAVMAPSLMAQSLVSGDLTGTVTDPSGAVVSGATVALQSTSTGATRNGSTSSNGTYRFSLLPPGSYMVTVTASGFSKAQTQTSVNIGQATVADVKMAVGATSQTVEVTSAAPLVQADTADLSTNFNSAFISNTPNGGNDLTYIAQTSPGAVMNTGGGYGNFSSYGLPATANLFTVNGENDMDPYLNLNNSGATNLTLGKNDIQEATVISNAYSGQYGQQAGAQVNYVTKSGTNQFHGDAIYYWNGSSLNANSWFNNLTQTPKPFANNNQWAAGVGGPIKKDKLFFYANNEGLRFVLPASGTVFAWTPNYINGSLAAVQAADPAELAYYQKYYGLYQSAPGYAAGATNPFSSNGDGGCGAPIVGNCINSYVTNGSQLGNEYILSGRVDYNLSDKDHLFWRVKMDRGTQPTSVDFINSAYSADSFQPSYDGQGQWSHVFGPNATNQFVYAGSYYRAIFTQNDPSIFTPTVIAEGFNLTRVGGNTYAFPQGRNVTQYQFVDDFSWTKGNHALKFGANFRRYDITDYAFSERTNPEVFLADPVAFFDGLASQTRQRFPSRGTEPVALWGLGLYAQDEWRASKSLKLTFALRAEHNSNPHCQLACGALLDGGFNNLVNTGVISQAAPYNSFINSGRTNLYSGVDSINWGPRFGFAWSPGGSDKTVVRGGFGIFYDALAAGVGDNFMLNLPNVVTAYIGASPVGPGTIPWGDTTTANSPYIQGANSAATIMSGYASGASYNSLCKPNASGACTNAGFVTPTFTNQTGTFHTPYYEQWSIGIQQALGDKASLSLGYVGNHGVRIPVENPAANAYGLGFPPIPNSPPTNVFTSVAEYFSGAVSNYNGLTATFTQRVTYGFTVQANYTWSHAMDEISNGGQEPFVFTTNESILYQINPACLKCNNYGNADYDIRNYFSASYVWQTPWKFGNKFVNGAIGGWTLSQNFFARGGLPFTVLDGNNGAGNYAPSIFPAYVIQPGQTSCNSGSNYIIGTPCLNQANFYDSAVTPFPPGFSNQRRNQYRGPGFFDSDFSINKNFKLTERLAFGVGANFYNIFNHPNFDQPDATLGDSTFGQVETTAPLPTGPYGAFFANLPSGRIIQFQGKLTF
ncbi:MAG: carboxypeptidase regulatory-like domain-containing protein [Candidatus Korobacteraceae bacterium]